MKPRLASRAALAAGALVAAASLMVAAPRIFGGTDAAPAAGRTAAQALPDSHPAPLFELQGVDGKTVKLADLKGKVVLVDFWATWCYPCRKGIPHLISLYDQYKSKGLVVVGISVDTRGKDEVAEFVQKNKITYPVVMADARTQRAYGGIPQIPTAFLIDKKGNIRRQYIGYQERDVLEKDLTLLLPGA